MAINKPNLTPKTINGTPIIQTLNRLIKETNGIGQDKKEAERQSSFTSINGLAISDKLHNSDKQQQHTNVITKLSEFITKTRDVKQAKNKHITPQVVQAFLEDRLLTCKPGTVKNDITEINRYVQEVAVDEWRVKNGSEPMITQSALQNIGKDLKRLETPNRAFKNAEKVFSKIPSENESAKAIAMLMMTTGMRIGDATMPQNLNITKAGRIVIEDSKAGNTYLTIKLDKIEIAKCERWIHQIKSAPLKTRQFNRIINRASKEAGETERSSHSFRYNFALKLDSMGYSHKEISQALGHQREEITQHYLRP